jgi:hypothetical protein
MQMPKGDGDLDNHEARLFLREALDLVKVAEELAALDEVHEEVDSVLVLEHVVHAHDEGVLDRVEDIFLELDVLELLIVDDYVLADALHRIDALRVHVLDQVDLAKGALANHLHDHEVLQAHRRLVGLVAREDHVAALAHGLTSGRLTLLVLLFVVLIFLVLQLLGEVLALLELLVSNLYVLLKVVSLEFEHAVRNFALTACR